MLRPCWCFISSTFSSTYPDIWRVTALSETRTNTLPPAGSIAQAIALEQSVPESLATADLSLLHSMVAGKEGLEGTPALLKAITV